MASKYSEKLNKVRKFNIKWPAFPILLFEATKSSALSSTRKLR